MSPECPNTLSKAERICGKKSIGALLEGGRWFSVPPLKCCVRPNTLEHSRIMVSVPKKNFKRAVRRNYLKRVIRENYRTRKSLLEDRCVDILFVYEGKDICSFSSMGSKMEEVLTKISACGKDESQA